MQVFSLRGSSPSRLCFHSISFPSEWGESKIDEDYGYLLAVSIQLVSPASGELMQTLLWTTLDNGRSSGFHSISFPSEWGVSIGFVDGNYSVNYPKFPFN